MDGPVPFRNVRVVFLDIDNTLYDYEGSMREHIEIVRSRFPELAKVAPEAFHDSYWRAFDAVPEEEKLHLLRTDVRAYRRRVWASALETFGESAPSADEAEKEFSALRDEALPPHPHAVDLVKDLAARGPVGVISNGPGDLQRRKLRALGVDRYVADDLVFISHEFGHDKPDARIFRAALDAAKAPARDCLMVGDDPVRDAGAKAVGMRVALLETRPGATVRYPGPPLADTNAPTPDARFRDFLELRAMLRLP